MKKFAFGLMLLIVGCSDPGEQAGSNLKKGDEFFAKNEYEIAEYYYEKIPEESPLYRQAQKKLNEITVIKEHWKIGEADSAEVAQVVLVENKYNADNTSKVPIHTLTLLNNSRKKLGSVNIEFTYYNAAGGVIAVLVDEVKTPLGSNTQGVFDKVSPGILPDKFERCEARIINAHF